MLRNYFAAALGNLARNRLYSILNIAGLGGLRRRDPHRAVRAARARLRRFLPGYENLYRLSSEITVAGSGSSTTDDVRGPIVEELKLSSLFSSG